jgi:hypothetical protein
MKMMQASKQVPCNDEQVDQYVFVSMQAILQIQSTSSLLLDWTTSK